MRGGEPNDQSRVAQRVTELSLGVFASPGYLALAGTPTHPRQLENSHHRIIGFSWGRAGSLYPFVMHRRGETVKMQGRYALAVDDGNAYLAAGVAGLGIMWLPRYMSKAHLQRGNSSHCSKTGSSIRCRFTLRIRPTALSARSCACLSTGSPN